jgi:hypothetical protein
MLWGFKERSMDEEKKPQQGDKIDQEKVASWLNAKWAGDKTCPVCRHNNWIIGGTISELRTYGGGGLFLAGKVYPVVVLTCSFCGNTLLVNAIVAELVPGVKEKEDNPEEVKK